jgi:hypothetical protein
MRRITPVGRITSVHGFMLPPKKRQQVKHYITLRFAIGGTIPSKKNMIWADSNLRTIMSKLRTFQRVVELLDWLENNLKVYIRNSQKYLQFVEETKPIIQHQAQIEAARYEKYGIIYPLQNVSVKVYHYWADNIERDNSNKYDTIIDTFVASGILTNDCWQVVRKNESEAECYHGEVRDHITTIDVTVRMV